MTPDEAFELLTKARQLDNKIGEVDPVRAATWAEELPDVSLRAGLAALSRHYRDNPETFNLGHVRPLAKKAMSEWKDQKRIDETKQRAIERVSRRAIEGPAKSAIDMSDQEKTEIARRRQDERAASNPEYAALLERMRAVLPPSKPGALQISGSMGAGRGGETQADRDALRGRTMPGRLGSLMGKAFDRLKGASAE